MRIRSLVPVGVLLGVWGCSGEPVAPATNLSGPWVFTFNTANAAAGVQCTGEMTFTISQTDQKFVGFQRGAGHVSCTGVALALVSPNPANAAEFDNETIGNGIVGEHDLAFTMNMLNSTTKGTFDLVRNQMSGTTTWELPVSPHGSIEVTGTWSAGRFYLE